MRLWYKMFRGVKFEEAFRDAQRYEEERAKQGDAVRIRPYKNGGEPNYLKEAVVDGLRHFYPRPTGGETNIFREGLKVLFPKPAKPYKNGGGFWDEALRVPKETYVPMPKDYSPILMKEGGDVPHNMIKHTSPLAMNQHGLFQHDLYNSVQQTGFGIKSYVKYV